MELNLISQFKAHPRHAQSVIFSYDGRELATTGMDALAQVWSVPEFEHSRSFHGHEKSVNAIDLSPDGALAITGSLRSGGHSLELEIGRGRFIAWRVTETPLPRSRSLRRVIQRPARPTTAESACGKSEPTRWRFSGLIPGT